MRRRIVFATVVFFAGMLPHLDGASIVTNGSFEQGTFGIGSFQGWQTSLGDSSTFVDSSGVTGPLYGQASDGLWAAYFGSTAADGGASISQILTTSIGQEYKLTFELANDNAGLASVNRFGAAVGGVQALSLTRLPNQPYVAYQYTFVAPGSQTALTFSGSNDNGYFELDNVAVSAVPEPAEVGLLISGALTVALVIRRRCS